MLALSTPISSVKALCVLRLLWKVRAWHADRQSVRERRGVEEEQPAPLIAAHTLVTAAVYSNRAVE